jgi:hypothetical protein
MSHGGTFFGANVFNVLRERRKEILTVGFCQAAMIPKIRWI